MNKLIDISDKSAICLSFLCVIHCIAIPILIIALPTLSGLVLLSDERFHLYLLFAVAPISIFAVATGYKHHKQASIFLLNATGVLLLISALIFGHDLFAGKGEMILTLIGSFLIVFSHIHNLKARRKKTCNNQLSEAV